MDFVPNTIDAYTTQAGNYYLTITDINFYDGIVDRTAIKSATETSKETIDLKTDDWTCVLAIKRGSGYAKNYIQRCKIALIFSDDNGNEAYVNCAGTLGESDLDDTIWKNDNVEPNWDYMKDYTSEKTYYSPDHATLHFCFNSELNNIKEEINKIKFTPTKIRIYMAYAANETYIKSGVGYSGKGYSEDLCITRPTDGITYISSVNLKYFGYSIAPKITEINASREKGENYSDIVNLTFTLNKTHKEPSEEGKYCERLTIRDSFHDYNILEGIKLCEQGYVIADEKEAHIISTQNCKLRINGELKNPNITTLDLDDEDIPTVSGSRDIEDIGDSDIIIDGTSESITYTIKYRIPGTESVDFIVKYDMAYCYENYDWEDISIDNWNNIIALKSTESMELRASAKMRTAHIHLSGSMYIKNNTDEPNNIGGVGVGQFSGTKSYYSTDFYSNLPNEEKENDNLTQNDLGDTIVNRHGSGDLILVGDKTLPEVQDAYALFEVGYRSKFYKPIMVTETSYGDVFPIEPQSGQMFWRIIDTKIKYPKTPYTNATDFTNIDSRIKNGIYASASSLQGSNHSVWSLLDGDMNGSYEWASASNTMPSPSYTCVDGSTWIDLILEQPLKNIVLKLGKKKTTTRGYFLNADIVLGNISFNKYLAEPSTKGFFTYGGLVDLKLDYDTIKTIDNTETIVIKNDEIEARNENGDLIGNGVNMTNIDSGSFIVLSLKNNDYYNCIRILPKEVVHEATYAALGEIEVSSEIGFRKVEPFIYF